jgi:hypothetical protein
MIFRRTLLAGLLIFAVSSCGGDDSSQVEDFVEDVTSNTDASTDMFNDEYETTGNDCVDAASAFGLAIGSLSVGMTGGDWDYDTYQKNMETARKTIGDFAKADFDTVANAYDALAKAVKDAQAADGISTPEGAEIIAAAGGNYDDAEVTAASDRVAQYYAVDCLEEYGQ